MTRRLQLVAAAFVASLVLAACGAPTAREARGAESGLDFVVPADWIEVERSSSDGTETARFGPPGYTDATFGAEPVFTVLSGGRSDAVSFQDLRTMVTGGEYDPLGNEVPEDSELTVTGYSEILEPEVWGLRIAVLTDQNQVIDMLGLVDRRSQTLSLASISCTQACYSEHADQIAEIQSSWKTGEN